MKKITAIFLVLFFCVSAGNCLAKTVTYSYDQNGRLTAADYGKAEITYAYDNNGNLTRRQIKSDSAADSSWILFIPVTTNHGKAPAPRK